MSDLAVAAVYCSNSHNVVAVAAVYCSNRQISNFDNVSKRLISPIVALVCNTVSGVVAVVVVVVVIVVVPPPPSHLPSPPPLPPPLPLVRRRKMERC